MQSCQKDQDQSMLNSDNSSDLTLFSNLSGASATILSTEIEKISTEDIQSVAVTKFDFGGAGKGQRMGGSPMGPMKFDIPRISDCATVTVSDTIYPKTITIDYGTGCTDGRGKVKKGKIVIVISDSLSIAGSSRTITYEDFYIDSTKVELSAKVENLGKNDAGNWIVANSFSQKLISPSGNVIVETSSETMEWTGGFETSDKTDDVFSKTGSGKITINDSLSFSRTITKALVNDNVCGNIISGTVELYRRGETVVIDYGSGSCDSKATVTANGTTEEIDLASRGFRKGGRFDKKEKGGSGESTGSKRSRGKGGRGHGAKGGSMGMGF
jgi:hypothetical protein